MENKKLQVIYNSLNKNLEELEEINDNNAIEDIYEDLRDIVNDLYNLLN